MNNKTEKNIKKILIIAALMGATLTVGAQKYSVRQHRYTEVTTSSADSVSTRERLRLAGDNLQRSAVWQSVSWGTAIVAGLCYSGIISEKRKVCNITGTAFALAAVASQVMSITYKHKSGAELKATATSITITF